MGSLWIFWFSVKLLYWSNIFEITDDNNNKENEEFYE